MEFIISNEKQGITSVKCPACKHEVPVCLNSKDAGKKTTTLCKECRKVITVVVEKDMLVVY